MYNPRDIAFKRLNHKTTNPIFCTNCGEYKHNYKECTKPIISLGIILYKKYADNSLKYLQLCRRNTIGYVQLIRGKYSFSDISYIQQIIDVLTLSELEYIKSLDFEQLWEILWQDIKFNKENSRTIGDKQIAKDKFIKLKDGFCQNNMYYNLDYFIKHKSKFYIEQEWGFPKGRRKKGEDDLSSATRELTEETGINTTDIVIDQNSKFIEEYKSYDNIIYRNIYYLAEYILDTEPSINETNMEQSTEISQIGLYTKNTIINKYRDYENSKKQLLEEVHNILTNIVNK
jgi:hypothetical protein